MKSLESVLTGLCGLFAALSVAAAADGQSSIIKDCEVCPPMAIVPAGEFQIGLETYAPMRGGQGRYMGPPRTVRISKPFALGQTEVTNAQFAAFVADNPAFAASSCAAWSGDRRTFGHSWQEPGLNRPPRDDEPVVCVTWLDAKAYTRWLSHKTGETYRLPSEAEWEYAAEGGTDSDEPWGDTTEALCTHGNIMDQSALKNADLLASSASGTRPDMAAPCDDGFPLVATVAQFGANDFGLYDMVGNVWEWVEDCSFIPYPERIVTGEAVQADGACELRAVRGGSWRTRASRQSVAWRGRDPESRSYHLFGFRVARDVISSDSE